jgi:16S rRNA C1402 (ribose-2'-O) methylase RsmI
LPRVSKTFEEVVAASSRLQCGSLSRRREITLVLAPAVPSERVGDTAEPAAVVADLVAAGLSRRQAADLVARLTGIPRNQLYRASL